MGKSGYCHYRDTKNQQCRGEMLQLFTEQFFPRFPDNQDDSNKDQERLDQPGNILELPVPERVRSIGGVLRIFSPKKRRLLRRAGPWMSE